MIKSKRARRALRALNFDLFAAEALCPPAPATLDHKIRHATRQYREAVQAEAHPPTGHRLPEVGQLYRLFERYNWVFFGGELPAVRIEYSDRMMSAGAYYPDQKLIRIGRKYHQLFPGDLSDTLKHEMIHIRHFGHNAAFKQEARRIGASVRARTHPDLCRPPRYVYACPACGLEYPRQKRLVMASCGKCSPGRKFHPRYKLKLKTSRKRRGR